jgi:AraC-like DNA-binding protein
MTAVSDFCDRIAYPPGVDVAGGVGRTVAFGFVRAGMDLAQSKGLDVRQALRQAGIPPELIGHDAARVTGAQVARVVQALWDASDDELVGVGPSPVPRGTFQMMTLGVIHTRDLRTALRRLIEFVRIGTGLEAAELIDDDRITRLSFDPGGRIAEQLLLAVIMAAVHRFAGWLIGQQIVLNSVDLPGSAPPHAAEYLLVYGVAAAFEAPTATIAFDSRFLSAPVVRSEDELSAFIRNLPHGLLFRQDYHSSTARRVRNAIECRTAAETVTADDVAKRLHISAQHLRRLLRDEGTSFRHIKEAILRDEAIAALVCGRETIEELSDRLGFSEPSAFRRAFHRWTGSPPGSYRPAPADRTDHLTGSRRSWVTDYAQ